MPMNKVAYNDCYGVFELSKEAKDWLKEHYPNYSDKYYSIRHDPRLIECIETLGDKVNETYSLIKIHEIKGNKYRINNYDGMETIIEPNDLNWIIIN